MPMKSAVNVVYRDLESSAALNAVIDKKVAKLSRFCGDIISSRVVIDIPHNHKHKGKMFRASLELDMKGAPLTVHCDDESVHIAVRDAFSSAERTLKKTAGRKRNRRGENLDAALATDTQDTDGDMIFDDYDIDSTQH
jgi:ribosomal subunit interface protein